jgi:hypothetical protein
VETDCRGQVPLDAPFAFRSESFEGCIVTQLRGYPGSDASVFRGNKLLGRTVLQGRFSERTPVQDVWMGQDLMLPPMVPVRCVARAAALGAASVATAWDAAVRVRARVCWRGAPLTATPCARPSSLCLAHRLERPRSLQRLIFTSAAKMFSSTYQVTVEGEGDAMGYCNPLLAVAEVLHVAEPGSEPDLHDVWEDARLMDARLVDKAGPAACLLALCLCERVCAHVCARVCARVWLVVGARATGDQGTHSTPAAASLLPRAPLPHVSLTAGAPLPGRARQRHFDRPANMEGVWFEPRYVYTAVISQSFVDLMGYRLKLGGLLNMDLCHLLNGQPLQYMCKNIRVRRALLRGCVRWGDHPPCLGARRGGAVCALRLAPAHTLPCRRTTTCVYVCRRAACVQTNQKLVSLLVWHKDLNYEQQQQQQQQCRPLSANRSYASTSSLASTSSCASSSAGSSWACRSEGGRLQLIQTSSALASSRSSSSSSLSSSAASGTYASSSYLSELEGCSSGGSERRSDGRADADDAGDAGDEASSEYGSCVSCLERWPELGALDDSAAAAAASVGAGAGADADARAAAVGGGSGSKCGAAGSVASSLAGHQADAVVEVTAAGAAKGGSRRRWRAMTQRAASGGVAGAAAVAAGQQQQVRRVPKVAAMLTRGWKAIVH